MENSLSKSSPDYAEIVDEFIQHIVHFVERPRPELSNFPVCPFARKARLESRIRFEVLELRHENIIAMAPEFLAQSETCLMVCIHPHRDGRSFEDVRRLVGALNRELSAANLLALGGHPDDPFNIDGLYTRREPYPNIQLIRLDLGEESYLSIKDSGYYDRWTEHNFKEVITPSSPTD